MSNIPEKIILTVDEERVSSRSIIVTSPGKIAVLQNRMAPILKPFAVNAYELKHILSEGHTVYAVNEIDGDQQRLTLSNFTTFEFKAADFPSGGGGDLPDHTAAMAGRALTVKSDNTLAWTNMDWSHIDNIPEVVKNGYPLASPTEDGLMSKGDKTKLDNVDSTINTLVSDMSNLKSSAVTKSDTFVENAVTLFDVAGNLLPSKITIKNDIVQYDNKQIPISSAMPFTTLDDINTYVTNNVVADATLFAALNRTGSDGIRNIQMYLNATLVELFPSAASSVTWDNISGIPQKITDLANSTIDATTLGKLAEIDTKLTYGGVPLVTSEYVDGKIVMSDTEPTNPTAGMIWIAPDPDSIPAEPVPAP